MKRILILEDLRFSGSSSCSTELSFTIIKNKQSKLFVNIFILMQHVQWLHCFNIL